MRCFEGYGGSDIFIRLSIELPHLVARKILKGSMNPSFEAMSI